MVKLSPRQIRTLKLFANRFDANPAQTYWRDPSFIGAQTGVHRTTGVLVDKGMIVINVPDETNRSSYTITITDAGRAFLLELAAGETRIHDVEAAFEAAIDEVVKRALAAHNRLTAQIKATQREINYCNEALASWAAAAVNADGWDAEQLKSYDAARTEMHLEITRLEVEKIGLMNQRKALEGSR